MKAVYSPYLLKKKFALNSQENSDVQPGVLIKIIDGDSWGVADLCPKPELGDSTLEIEIQKKGSLFSRAVELACEDLAARKEKYSLLQNKAIKNNFLIPDYKNTDLNQDCFLKHTVKIKGDRDIKKLSQLINAISSDIKIRIDFNSILNAEEFEEFLNLLTPPAKNKIEYIEDPTEFHSNWKIWNKIIPLAFDFQKTEYNREFAKFLIIKPSRQRTDKISENFTFTSAMDHPIGVAHGLRFAQKLAQNDSGFLTLDLFENIGFNKYFSQVDCFLNFSALALNDFGIGMSEELSRLNWLDL